MINLTINEICLAVKRLSELAGDSMPFAHCLNIRHELQLVQHIEKLEAEVARLQEIVEYAAYNTLESGE